MKWGDKIICMLLLLFSIAKVASAQEIISIHVMDNYGKNLEYVNITIRNQSDPSIISYAITDSLGICSIRIPERKMAKYSPVMDGQGLEVDGVHPS